MVPANAMAPVGTPMNEGYYQQAVVAITSVPEPAIKKVVPSSTACSCILYVKARLGGDHEPWLYPNRMTASKTEPYVGGIVITTEGPVGHVAFIESVDDGVLTISEANYERCKITTRKIPIDYPRIRGYK